MKVQFYVYTDNLGSEVNEDIEIPDQEIEDMTKEELEVYLEEYAGEWKMNHSDYGYRILTGSED